MASSVTPAAPYARPGACKRVVTEVPAGLADERDDAVVLGELEAAPAAAQPSCREHGFALKADQRPAVAARKQAKSSGAAHRVTDRSAWAAFTSRAPVNQGERGHGPSLARAHKKANRRTGELTKSQY